MRTTHLWILLGSLAGSGVFWPGVSRGQDLDAAAIHYGDGVHAYFAGNASRAEQSLSSALVLNSQDPRIYYFRALSLLRQGRTAEARGDMLVGAALEAQRPNRFAVGTALMRVQGRDRLLLEQFRRQARLDAGGNGASRGQAVSGEQPEAVRERVVIPLDEYLRPGVPQPAGRGANQPAAPRTFSPDTPDDPFRDDPQAPSTRVPVVPPATPTGPIETPPEAPAASGGDDPFGTL